MSLVLINAIVSIFNLQCSYLVFVHTIDPDGNVLVSFTDRTTLYCSSKNLIEAVENSTVFCSICGKQGELMKTYS